jgi:putative phosphoribosyl transferase
VLPPELLEQTFRAVDDPAASRFVDRSDAGRQLAEALAGYRDSSDLLVLALPRGGVPVAAEVARSLDAPLDLMMVRKLGVPWHRELAMGAVATGGVRVLNDEVVSGLGIKPEELDAVTLAERRELQRRQQAYRGDRPQPEIEGRTVIIVDDGLATGSTMRAAITAVKEQGPNRVVVAVPVAPPETCEDLEAEVDDLVCLQSPDQFMAIGLWYESFPPVSDDEVRALLDGSLEPR